MTHPFRFGVQASTVHDSAGWTGLARGVEAAGYSTLLMPDHFDEQLAPMPALAHAAAVTTDLRVGALVWDNDYKHPVVLAKEVATLDVLSGGRVEMGLGAGWMRTDYERSGIPYDPNAVRVDRFEESLGIYDAIFAGETVDHEGEHYRLSGYVGHPAPVQRPRPPLLIGGGGPRVLGIAARHADIVGINPNLREGEVGAGALADVVPDAVDTKVARVREAAGARFADIELNLRVFFVQVTDDRDGALAGMAEMFGVDAEVVGSSPYVMVGTTDQIADRCRAVRDRWGFSYLVFGADVWEALAPTVGDLAGT